MRKKKSFSGWIILIIVIVITVAIAYFVIKNMQSSDDSEETITKVQTEKTTIINSISSSNGISSALTENLELHATYYLEEVYVKQNQYVASGANILKYTNGTYMTAPYNCVVTEISVPDVDGQCTNKHYIKVQSTEILQMTVIVNEDELDDVFIGQEAQITADVLPDKTYSGNVTAISSEGTYSSSSESSTFTVTVEFENDGNLSIGMSATCNVILEKAENVLAVPTEAVTTENNVKYVNVMNADGTTYTKVEIETGISNDAYIEVKSGLDGTETLAIIEDTSETTNSKSSQFPGGGMGYMQGGDQSSFDGGQMPTGGTPPSGVEMPTQSQGN